MLQDLEFTLFPLVKPLSSLLSTHITLEAQVIDLSVNVHLDSLDVVQRFYVSLQILQAATQIIGTNKTNVRRQGMDEV